MSGHSKIFSGENIRLRCSVPDGNRSTWSYLWFRGSEQLPQSGEHLVLWKARVQESGKYYCQGLRDTAVGDIRTQLSLPVEITVDGRSLFISTIRNLLNSPMSSPYSSLTLFPVLFLSVIFVQEGGLFCKSHVIPSLSETR